MSKRKVLCLVVALLMCVTLLAACGDKTDDEGTDVQATISPAPIQTTDTSPTPAPMTVPTLDPAATVSPDAAGTNGDGTTTDGTTGTDGTATGTNGDGTDASASAEPSASASASASTDSGTTSTKVLKEKSEGDEVTKLQERLKELGYIDKVTGYYGTETEAAVKKFQEKSGLEADGIAGSATQKAIYASDAKKAS